MPIVSEKDYLEHYGVKGMKWYQHIFGDLDSRAKYSKKKSEKKQGSKKLSTNQKALIGVGATAGILATAYTIKSIQAKNNVKNMRRAHKVVSDMLSKETKLYAALNADVTSGVDMRKLVDHYKMNPEMIKYRATGQNAQLISNLLSEFEKKGYR